MWFIDLIYKVRDIMDTNVVLLHKDTTLGETIDIMFKNRREEVLIVDDRKDLIGIFTKMDIPTQDNLDRIRNKKIYEFMQKNVITISPDDNVRDARNLMLRLNIGRLPVIEGNKVIGILTATNIRDKFYLRIDELFGFQKNILENLHEAVCIINKKGVVIYWNKSAEKLYNISAAEILGKNISEIFPDALILKALKGEKIENVYHKPTKDKTVILSVVPIYNTNNEVIAAVSTDRDVTEVVNLSVQLENEKKKVEFLKSQYNKEIAEKFSFSSIYGKSKKILDAISIARRVASSNASVLIMGESGTGKEVFAKAIHQASGREGNFVAINCSAIPENLLESELFGYVEGAFTGALKKGKIGKFEFANNGTIFLDEIGDMPLNMQAKLLRVLQDGVVYRLGDEKPIKINARVIAATNKNLNEMIKKGLFRDDLYYRLSVVNIYLPPLRERKEDIRELSNLFFDMYAKEENKDIEYIDEKVYDIFENYIWEGNVRELKNVVQRMVVLSQNGRITTDLVPEYIRESVKDELIIDEFDLQKMIEKVERDTIRRALELSNGNKKKAAELLKIKRSTLYYKIEQYGL